MAMMSTTDINDSYKPPQKYLSLHTIEFIEGPFDVFPVETLKQLVAHFDAGGMDDFSVNFWDAKTRQTLTTTISGQPAWFEPCSGKPSSLLEVSRFTFKPKSSLRQILVARLNSTRYAIIYKKGQSHYDPNNYRNHIGHKWWIWQPETKTKLKRRLSTQFVWRISKQAASPEKVALPNSTEARKPASKQITTTETVHTPTKRHRSPVDCDNPTSKIQKITMSTAGVSPSRNRIPGTPEPVTFSKDMLTPRQGTVLSPSPTEARTPSTSSPLHAFDSPFNGFQSPIIPFGIDLRFRELEQEATRATSPAETNLSRVILKFLNEIGQEKGRCSFNTCNTPCLFADEARVWGILTPGTRLLQVLWEDGQPCLLKPDNADHFNKQVSNRVADLLRNNEEDKVIEIVVQRYS